MCLGDPSLNTMSCNADLLLINSCRILISLHTTFFTAFTSMALGQVIALFLFAFALSRFQLSTCQLVRGSVSCLDCSSQFDFSGIKVAVKCDKLKKLTTTTTTEANGSFQVDLPIYISRTPTCIANVLGGPSRLYVSKHNMVSKIVKTQNSSAYTISTPLAFFTTCPSGVTDCRAPTEIGSSKTVDLAVPREWGLAPTSYYFPFIPIIGIP